MLSNCYFRLLSLGLSLLYNENAIVQQHIPLYIFHDPEISLNRVLAPVTSRSSNEIPQTATITPTGQLECLTSFPQGAGTTDNSPTQHFSGFLGLLAWSSGPLEVSSLSMSDHLL